MFDINTISLEDLLTLGCNTESVFTEPFFNVAIQEQRYDVWSVQPSNRQQLLSAGLLSSWMETGHRVSLLKKASLVKLSTRPIAIAK